MTKKTENDETKKIREQYSCYKVADLAVKLHLNKINPNDIDYIMHGGENIETKPYTILQSWLAQAMDRMEERLPKNEAIQIRQDSACCLSGIRDTLAKAIYKNNPTIETRFEAFKKEKKIFFGKAWKDNDDYYISFWHTKPLTGYTCGCLRCIPNQPMNKLWCECCSGHIKHHFETALGVKTSCTCITSVLSSCGEEACLFKLNIIK